MIKDCDLEILSLYVEHPSSLNLSLSLKAFFLTVL